MISFDTGNDWRSAFHWHQVYRLPVVSIRIFNAYGPRSKTTGDGASGGASSALPSRARRVFCCRDP